MVRFSRFASVERPVAWRPDWLRVEAQQEIEDADLMRYEVSRPNSGAWNAQGLGDAAHPAVSAPTYNVI
jgi:hypothetical protein